jgi:apolipoprotein N-acyltransferase
VVNSLKVDGKSVDVSGVMQVEIPVYKHKNTIYVKFGDWFLTGWCGITGGLFIWTFRRK